MFNPQSLRICCLATMAPALTSEAVTRARDKLTGSPASPSVPVMNGRDHQISINNASKSGIAHQTRQHFVATTKPSQVIRLSKDLQKKLSESDHLVNSSKPMEHGKAVNLGTVTSLSQLYQQHNVLGTSSSTSTTRSQQSDNLICTSVSKVPSSASQSPGSLGLIVATPKNNGTITTASTSGQRSILSQCDRTASVDLGLCRTCPSTSSGESVVASGESIALKEDLTTGQCADSHVTPKPKMNVSNGFSALMNVTAHSRASIIPAVSSLGANKLCSFIVGRSNTDKQSTSQLLNSVQRRQKILETRVGRLMCRLRRLQCRQAISHTKQQLSGFVEQQQQEMPTSSRPAAVDLQTELLHSKSMSTAALVELVHKMQSSQASLHQHLSASSHSPNEPTKLGEERCAELERVSNHLRSNLSHLQSALDSDATESSSGGESCDELDYDEEWDGKMPRPPIHCRAEWHWASDRAAVASRWTWLQAQVSDLEYRIRQQYDIYKQIKASKGCITLGEPPPPDDLHARSGKEHTTHKLSSLEEKIANLHAKNDTSPGVPTLLGSLEKQSDNVKNQVAPFYTPQASPISLASSLGNAGASGQKTPSALNGFIDGAAVQAPGENLYCIDDTFQAARCRPVKSYRKRKLLSTSGLHQQNRKAAKLSTVLCHCYPPVMSCAMCGGRYNNTMKVDALTMPLVERVALLDTSFHPVLSFPEDIGLSTHFESMLKTGEWQQKPPPKAYKVLQPDRKRLKLKHGVRRYQRKLKKNTSAAILSSTKIRNKYEQKQLGRNLVNSPVKVSGGSANSDKKLMRAEVRLRKQKMFESLHHISRVGSSNDLHSGDSSVLGSSNQSQLWKELKEGMRRKRGESAYDINNIVIPYSIAATTRVERLQYKEILTPKWREVNGSADDESSDISMPPVASEASASIADVSSSEPGPEMTKQSTSLTELDDSEVEDLSDEVFRQRHLRCEISEKQRFATALPSKSKRRSRSSQRLDSNSTQLDPISPDVVQQQQDSVYTVTPPSTPGPSGAAPEDSDDITKRAPHQDYGRKRSSSVSSAKSNRSRSTSHSEERRLIYEDDRPAVAPWTKRTFPLTEDEFEMLTASPSAKNCCLQLRDGANSAKVITEEMVITVPNLPTSPMHADNSDTSSDIVEDPDDPEWTVVTERHHQQIRQSPLVLKLAKR